MSSSVYFKFKSQKEPSRVEFDGTGISVFELKRDIIIKSGLGDGTEFDLVIVNEDSMEEYDDDTTIIPRSTSVIARRLPPMKKGAGKAFRYVSGKAPANAKNSSRREPAVNKTNVKPASSANGLGQMNSAMTEEERLAAMFQASEEQWSAQQAEMANQTPIYRPGSKKSQPQANVPDHEPPPGYVCYRCGEKGHWIQVCPTNDDPNFDNKPRVKRTTGIPRSFLKTVEKPVAMVNDGTMDETKPPSGIMVNADGEYVIAEPDMKSWEQFQAKTQSSAAAQKAAALGDKELQERGLECPIDKRILIDPMKTPCCEKSYCNDCITNALIESDFTCPACQTDGVLIDDLKPDDETTAKIKAYLEEKTAEKKEKDRESSPSVKSDTAAPSATAAINSNLSKAKSPSPSPKSPATASTTTTKSTVSPKSPNVTDSFSAPNPESAPQPVSSKDALSITKKRGADELLENPKVPKAPKAMQQKEAAQQNQAMAAMMTGMPGMSSFPNAGFEMSGQFFGGMPGMNGMNGMSMPVGMGMPGMNGMMNGFGMGMNGIGMNGLSGMNMQNMAMMNPMMGMGMGMQNGFGGFPGMNMNGMNGSFPHSGGNANNGYHNNNMNGNYNGNGTMNGNGNGNASQGFQNQHRTVFAEPLPNEEDNAYFRKPVNPHRHQGRTRRARPSDYREL